jgi:predicted short-subunit dehydrogenase-like oxidoreductase (DUF2520 family)
MVRKPRIAIVGPGRIGSALAVELWRAGFCISEVVSGGSAASRRKARALANKVHATWRAEGARLDADVIWFCVPDREIAAAARGLAKVLGWRDKIALHSSGALASDELRQLRRRGASVASVHPLMTFVSRSVPSLKRVPFAVEGDAAALRVAKRIVRALGGKAFAISRKKKLAYHAWGALFAPLFVSLLVTGEQVAGAAGFSKLDARRKMLPIVRQTLANYAKLGPAGAFSGPMVRGDAEVVLGHLKELKRIPQARDVYVALGRAALRYLPAGNRKALEKALGRRKDSR